MNEPEEAGVRPQGRPPRSGREIGRDHLIESTRGAMRARPKLDIQRREIAEHAGVTPALVSYYFPDKAALLEAAAQPVIESYAADVERLLKSRAEPRSKLKRLTVLFLTFNREQGFILDHYLELGGAQRRDANVAILAAVERKLHAFCAELIECGIVKGDDPRVLPAALWALCRHLGRGGQTDLFQIDGEVSAPLTNLADKILKIIQA